MKSTHALLLVALVWILLGGWYYPKWAKSGSEAAISWDVSGYYHYLPAIFIYGDLKRQDWMTYVNETYLPSPAYDQSFVHEVSGQRVNKYAIGQAVLYTPFFLIGHMYARLSDSYPADGYSRPYQIAIWLGSLLVSVLGLIWLRTLLLHYVRDDTTGWAILALGLGTHWMEYAAIGNGMNHTWLFTLLCGLMLAVIRYYASPSFRWAAVIGACLGLAVLTRPTEIIWVFIPLLWGMTSLRERLADLTQKWRQLGLAALIAALVISLQPLYWKYVSGEWIVYSYGDQGFNWLRPRIWRGLMGVNIGWWLYTPMMLVAMAGWRRLFRIHAEIFWAVALTSGLGVYITLSWSHFESGGGLGQRNLIQLYPLLGFPLAMVIESLTRRATGRGMWIILLAANMYYTGWWVYQAHTGGYFKAGQMTTPYFMRVVGRLHPDPDYVKLLDTREYFAGTPRDVRPLLTESFESDTTDRVITHAGSRWLVLDKDRQSFGPVGLPPPQPGHPWLRLECEVMITAREWDHWKFAQWIVQFHRGEEIIKTNLIRLQRLISTDHVPTQVFFDVKVPVEPYDRCSMTIWNAESAGTILIDNLKVSSFK